MLKGGILPVSLSFPCSPQRQVSAHVISADVSFSMRQTSPEALFCPAGFNGSQAPALGSNPEHADCVLKGCITISPPHTPHQAFQASWSQCETHRLSLSTRAFTSTWFLPKIQSWWRRWYLVPPMPVSGKHKRAAGTRLFT